MSRSRQGSRRIGAAEERAAADFLVQHGVEIVERNFRSGRTGEIDLIGYDGRDLVFFEVKYRSSDGCGAPEESVTPAKQRVISQTARFYLARERISPDRPIRFDVIAIRPAAAQEGGGSRIALHWVRNAFDYCGPSV